MRGEEFATKSVIYLVICSFVISLFGLLTDGYGCFTLASSPWFQTVGGITLFGMILVEFLLLLVINLVCFGLIAFTGDNRFSKIGEFREYERENYEKNSGIVRFPSDVSATGDDAELGRNRMTSNRTDASVWPSFTSPSDLYRIKSINYRNDSFYHQRNSLSYII